jgi:3',5'-cyclic AMP phosphodiesterase CpdA
MIIACALCLLCVFASLAAYYYLDRLHEEADSDPSLAPESHFEFVVFGDSRGGSDLRCVSESFDDFIDNVSQLDTPMALVVGDFYVGDPDASESVRQAQVFLDMMGDLTVPWYPIMGNHEAQGNGWGVARDMIFQGGSTYYSFDHNESHFVVLDAFMPSAWFTLSEEQMDWLSEDLGQTAKPHVFVFVHAPLYPLGPHIGESLDSDIHLRDSLAELFVEHEVDVVFCGHEHFYASFGYRGLMQVTSGGAGATLHGHVEFEDLDQECGYSLDQISRHKVEKALHYVCVNVTSDLIDISAYDLQGNLIDHFTLPP